MYLISLIIPIYNAEEFLDNTINSVINQSIGFNNIELILVDDNSKDGSKKIIEAYSKKYENIVPFFSEENHGFPGFGRNIGMKKATADYIMFMDNDDEIDVDMCKTLYETIIDEKADVVCCDKVVVDSISEIRSNINYENGIENNNQILIKNDDILLFNNISVWNKIYKKQIILENNLKFKENTSADDFIFTTQYFLKSKKLIYLKNYFGYYWNIKSDSLSHVSSIEYVEEMPTYPGGMSALMTFVSKNFKCPKEVEELGIQGRIVCTLVINEDGSISDIKVVKPVHPLFDAESIRVMESMPKWNPGKHNGKPVKVKYTIPMTMCFRN